MPQQNQQDKRTLAQKIIDSPKTKVAAAVALTTARVATDTARALRRKDAVDKAIKSAGLRIPNPKYDPTTGQKLPLSSQSRADQTAKFTEQIKNPLLKEGKAAAITREASSIVRPNKVVDKIASIKRSLQNIKASQGKGAPATRPAIAPVLPKRETFAAIIDKANSNVTDPFEAASKPLTAATNMKELRKAVAGMQKVGGVRPSILGGLAKTIGNKEINPTLTKGVNVLKSAGGVASKVIGYGAVPLSLGVNYLAKRDAESFADAQRKPAKPNPAVPAPADVAAQTNVNEDKYTDELIDFYSKTINDVEKLDYDDNARNQKVWNTLREHINKNPQYLKSWKSETFKQQRSELGLRE